MKNYLDKILNYLFTSNIINKKKINLSIKNRKNLHKNVFSVLNYKNESTRNALLDLKFKNKTENAVYFGELLFEYLPEYLEDLKIQENFYEPLLITVPISFIRKIKRGYNQNNLIINSFMKIGGKNFIKWEKNNLIKWKHTKPQSLMKNKKERRNNQNNAFLLLFPSKIKNRNIIIFDDIYTTGSTINEIKKVLKKAGAKKIITVVLSH